MTQSDSHKQEERGFRAMTPAQVREFPGADFIEVVFLESARFYKLFRKTPAFDEIVDLLHDAISKHHTVQIRSASPHGDVIEAVER